MQSMSMGNVSQSSPATLIEYYLRDEGGAQLQQLLNLNGKLTHDVMPRAAAAVVQLLYVLY